jgi:hypothetical protein
VSLHIIPLDILDYPKTIDEYPNCVQENVSELTEDMLFLGGDNDIKTDNNGYFSGGRPAYAPDISVWYTVTQ